MGRVFSYEEIKSGKIPTPDDFEIAKDVFANMVEIEIDRGNIDGAFIYGSVAIGTQSCRSDFDALVSLTEGSPENYIATRAICSEIKRLTKITVPIEAFAYAKDDLKTGQHTIDRLFGVHLSGGDRIVIGENDPAVYMTFCGNNPSAKDIFASYLYSKKFRMNSAYLPTDDLDAANGGLQRLLELPNSIGRKALQALAESGKLPPIQISSVDKQLIANQGHDLFTQYGINEGFDDLVAANRDYDKALESAIQGDIDRPKYEDEIRGLHAKIPHAIKWLRQVQVSILPLFDNQ